MVDGIIVNFLLKEVYKHFVYCFKYLKTNHLSSYNHYAFVCNRRYGGKLLQIMYKIQ